MFSKNYLLLSIIIIMITFFEKVDAKYDRLFFDLQIEDIDGKNLDFSKYKDNIILLVNVASNCGFTKQYTDLQNLYEKYSNKGLVVIGVPSNQFGGQEPGSNNDIKKFCSVNFNITFPITNKVDVKGENAHDIYKWAKKNYGKSTVPKWNFHKILINKNGKIEDTFASFTNPMSKKITNKVDNLLK